MSKHGQKEKNGMDVKTGAFMAGQGSKARSIAWCDDGTTPTLKGQPSGLNMAPSCVYPINTMVALRGGKDDMRTCFGVGEANDPQFTLSAAHGHAVCYAIEGNVVDRVSAKNGKGWCEDVSPTLNTQDRHAVMFAIEGNGQRESHQGNGYAETDTMYTLNTIERHAVCFQLCGDRDNPSVSTSDKAYCIPANPMSDRGQAVCFQQNQREEVRNMGETAGCLNADSGMHNTNYVCFRKVSKPGADGKGERWEESEITNTLNGFEFHSDVRTPEAVCYIIDPLSSNSMKSSNPHSGIHPTDVCKCLDTQCLNPSCNQGGVIVCYAPNGNHCGAFLPTQVSATLETKYHYGSGGDAALVVEKRHE